MLPASVVGGARISGFCWSIGIFSGPRIVAPREPRIGWTSSVVVTFHSMKLGSSLASGIVKVGEAAVLVVEVASIETLSWTVGVAEVLLELAEMGNAEAAGAPTQDPASRIAQKTEVKSLFMPLEVVRTKENLQSVAAWPFLLSLLSFYMF